MISDLMYALAVIGIWCLIFFVGGVLALTVAVLYRITVEHADQLRRRWSDR